MKRQPTESSMIKSVGYLPKYEILEVEFNNNAVYHYYYVTAEIYKKLTEADSIGKAFNEYVKGKCPDFKGSFQYVPTDILTDIKPIENNIIIAMIPVIPTNISDLRSATGDMLKKPGSFDQHPHQGIIVAISDQVTEQTGMKAGDRVFLTREPKFMSDVKVVNDLFLYNGVGYFQAKKFDILAYSRDV